MENNRFEKSNTCLSPIDEVIKKRFDEKGKLIERRTREETVEYVGGRESESEVHIIDLFIRLLLIGTVIGKWKRMSL